MTSGQPFSLPGFNSGVRRNTYTYRATVPRGSCQCHSIYLGSTNQQDPGSQLQRQRKEGEEAEKERQRLSEEFHFIPWPRPVSIWCVSTACLKDVSIVTQALPTPDFCNVWKAHIRTARLSPCTWCSSYQHTALARGAERRWRKNGFG